MSEQTAKKPGESIYIRAVLLVDIAARAGRSIIDVKCSEVVRLVAEVFRLRAKCRCQKAQIRALTVERDALAQLAVAYAPRAEQAPEHG